MRSRKSSASVDVVRGTAAARAPGVAGDAEQVGVKRAGARGADDVHRRRHRPRILTRERRPHRFAQHVGQRHQAGLRDRPQQQPPAGVGRRRVRGEQFRRQRLHGGGPHERNDRRA
jgi:hypothetical protein